MIAISNASIGFMQALPPTENNASMHKLIRSQSHLASLDGARALSILLVLIAHGAGAYGLQAVGAQHDLLEHLGQLGVSIFFVISGLLITWLMIKERDATGSVSLSSFYIRRALRILPVFCLLILSVSILKQFKFISITWVDIFRALSFTHNYPLHLHADIDYSWWLHHTWSLSLEEQFYLVWPSLFVFLPKRISPRLAVVLAFAGPLLRLMNYFFLPAFRGAENGAFHTRIDILMVGCAAAFLLHSPRSRLRIHAIPVWPALLISALFLLVIDPYIAHHVTKHSFFAHLLILIMPTLEGLAIVISLLVLIAGKHGTAFQLFNLPVFNHIGRLSYSLYIWQQLFLLHDSARTLLSISLRMALIYLVARCSFHFLEQPFLKLRSRFRRGVAV